MADMRISLLDVDKNARLMLDNFVYHIREIKGRGGSCIAYTAEREPSDDERKIGISNVPVIIKEFYPLEISEYVSRIGDELQVNETVQATFNILKERFEKGAARQVAHYSKDCNHSLPPARIKNANSTLYSIVELDLSQGIVLNELEEKLTMREISQVMISIRNTIAKLHCEGNLYLDLKPSNIFLFIKERSESRRIAMFDFDTVIPTSEIETAVIPFSGGWSPYEQINQQRENISYATDIYAIGATFYWLIGKEKVTDKILSDIKRRRFDFLNDLPVLSGMKNARKDVERFLSITLRRSVNERKQNVEGL
jgi:serine/threonine protein kinase